VSLMIVRILLASLALCVGIPASGQQAPRFSGLAQVGLLGTAGGDFRETAGIAARIAVAARMITLGGVSLVAALSHEAIGTSGDETSICIVSPRGGCKPFAAQLGGLSGRLGLERSFGAHLALGASLGAGWYDNNGSGNPSGARVVPISVDVFVPVVSHVSIAATAERLEFRDYGGLNFHANTFLIGLRGQ
jgi:hypothetical protein